MVLLVLLCHVAFVKRELAPFLRFSLMGLLGGFIVLARTTHFPGLVLLMLYAAWRHRHQVSQMALMGSFAILLMVLLNVPHRYSIDKLHGDPFWDMHLATRLPADSGFVGRPSFPSRSGLENDPSGGPKQSYAQDVFERYTPVEVIIGSLTGLMKIAARMNVVGFSMRVPALGGFNPGWTDAFVTALGAIGFFVALCSAEFRWLPLVFFSLTFPVGFLFGIGFIEPYRLTMQAFPFFLLCGLLAVRQGCAWTTPNTVQDKPLGQSADAFGDRLHRSGPSPASSRILSGPCAGPRSSSWGGSARDTLSGTTSGSGRHPPGSSFAGSWLP